MRNGELSIVDIDGIMMDGDDEMNDYYAGIVSSPVSAVGSDHHPRDISISPSQRSSDCVFLNAAVSARPTTVSVESEELKKTRFSQKASGSFVTAQRGHRSKPEHETHAGRD